MWNFDQRTIPFGPEVKSQRIRDFLQEPDIANAPSHLEAYELAEKRYSQWTREQDHTATKLLYDGKDHGACPCGYTYKSEEDHLANHGLTCRFSPDYDEQAHMELRRKWEVEAKALSQQRKLEKLAFPKPPAYRRVSRTYHDTPPSNHISGRTSKPGQHAGHTPRQGPVSHGK